MLARGICCGHGSVFCQKSGVLSKQLNVAGCLLAQRLPRLVLHCFERNSSISKNTVPPSGTLLQTLKIADFSGVFSPRLVDRRRCCQLSSTDDRCLCITLSVHLCLRHDGCDAARRASSSATAESCILL